MLSLSFRPARSLRTPSSRCRRTLPLLSASVCSLVALALSAPAAQAQANLTFTIATNKGNSLLVMTLASPVSYTITTATSNGYLFFVFEDITDGTPHFDIVTGNITYSLNGGPDRTINRLATGDVVPGVLAATDFYIYLEPQIEATSVGNVVVLKAGTLTTNANYHRPTPTSGSATTFIFSRGAANADFVRVSSNGVSAAAAPEPGTLALLALGGLPLAGVAIRRRRSA